MEKDNCSTLVRITRGLTMKTLKCFNCGREMAGIKHGDFYCSSCGSVSINEYGLSGILLVGSQLLLYIGLPALLIFDAWTG